MNHSFFDSASYAFSAYSVPVALVAILTLGLGLATLIREHRSPASIAFLIMQMTVAGWLLIYAAAYSATNTETAAVWFRILGVELVWIPVAVLAFAIAVSEKWQRLWPIVAVAAIATSAFMVAGLVENSFFTKEVREFFWGYYPIAGPGTTLYAIYQTSCLLGAAGVLWMAQHQTQSSIRRHRLRALLLGLMVSYVSGIDFLPTSGVEMYPFGFVFIAAFVILGTRAIWRYRLVDLTPELAAPQIINTMSEAVLVVDSDGLVRVANDAAAEMFSDGRSLVGTNISDVTSKTVQEIIGVQDDGDVNHLEFTYGDEESRHTAFVSSRALTSSNGDLLGTIHIGHDITERKRAEEALARSESIYRTLFETSPDAVILTDRTGTIVMANHGAALLLRTGSTANLIGKSAVEFISEADRERMSEMLGSIAESRVLRSDEYSLRVADGREVPVELSLSRIRDTEGEVDGFLAIARDISERKRAANMIHDLAYHDALTGLANRSLLLQSLSEAMTHADETDTRVAILYLDLDGMKAVNDTFGHATGDEVLRSAGERLSIITRDEDSLARIGGDEFVIVVPGIERESQVISIADRVLDAIREPFVLPAGEYYLSVSIGIGLYPTNASGIEGLLRKADEAMYMAKARGGNLYAYAEASGGLARVV